MSSSRSRPPQYRANTGHRRVQEENPYKKPNGFLSFILYLITTFFILVFIFLLVLHTAGVGNVIRNTDILYYLEDFAVDGHNYYIVDQINNLPFSNNEVTLTEIEDFIKTESVTESINSIVEGYAQAFAMGNLEHHVTAAEVAGIAHDLSDEISEFFGHEMTDDDIDYLAERLDDLMDFNSMTIDGLMEDFDMDMSVPLMLLSPALRWLVGTLCIFLLIAIFAIRLNSLPHAFCAVGIPITIAGLISFAVGMYIDTASHTPGNTLQQFERFLEEPLIQIMQYGFIFAAAGILIIIIAKTFGWAAKRR
ncbi:MAG: hypothetical protein FWD38_00460 [Oscillospiraceae bacterium]|nr:hypothetical protein [Oscillospiraceae bacterium]